MIKVKGKVHPMDTLTIPTIKDIRWFALTIWKMPKNIK